MSGTFTVFHLDGERGLRGGERQALYLAAALRARGHENVFACRRGAALAAEARKQGFETLELPYAFEFDPVTAWKIARDSARRSRAVLHAHTAHAAGIASLARTMGGAPTVVHRRVDFHLRGGLSRRFKYENAGRVVAVSEAIARVLEQDGLPRARVAVVPDALPVGLDESRWAAAEPGRFAAPSPEERAAARRALSQEFDLAPNAPWIGNAAALVPHKDHETLIAAALLVILKKKNAIFLIAGRGPEEKHLFDSIRRMGLVGKVVLIGHLSDAVPLLKAVDVFALSSWGEGMGSVLLEAAACGAPIAATTAGGIPEVVADGRTGLLCPPRDPEALAANILRLLEDRDAALGFAASARAELPRFGLARMAGQMEEIYASLS